MATTPAVIPNREVTLHLRIVVLKTLEETRPPDCSLPQFMAQLLEACAAERRAKTLPPPKPRPEKRGRGRNPLPIEASNAPHQNRLDAGDAQRVLHLRNTYGLTIREIAERMGKSVSVIRRVFVSYEQATHVQCSTGSSGSPNPQFNTAFSPRTK